MSAAREKTARYLPRAKKACQNCHARRVRCNVMEHRPCHNCRVIGVPCELTKSKREVNRERKMALLNQEYPSRVEDELHRSREETWTNWAREGRETTQMAQRTEPSIVSPTSNNNVGDAMPPPPDVQLATLEEPSTILVSPAKSSTTRDEPDSSTINDETVYIGESNLLTLVASSDNHVQSSSATNANAPSLELGNNLTYQLSSGTNMSPASAMENTSSCTSGALDYLNREGAFTFPEDEVTTALLQAYFKWFHTCFPVVDASQISREYATKKISPMLLQAMLFIGTSYLADEFFLSRGFTSRQDAKFHFYYRAKILYDAGWEVNKTAIVQTLFLISFWRSHASNDKDTRHWLAAAVSFAQTRGYHRSLSRSNATTARNKHILSLRKRIWWSLYIRDRQCAASLGLPCRIRDEDCDVEKLCADDFAHSGPVELPEIFDSSRPEHTHYCIAMAELAVLLGKIVLKKFAPRDETASKQDHTKLKSQLALWEERLPETMRARSLPSSIWNNMLHLQHNHLLILLYGSVNIGTDESSETGDHALALEAAHRNTRIIEDLLAKDLVQNGQIHLITCIFSTLCVHVLQMRQSARATTRQLAEYRARICLMGLKELRFSWDANNWILQLFYQFLDDETAKTLNISEVVAGGHASAKKPLTATGLPMQPAATPSSRSVWEDEPQVNASVHSADPSADEDIFDGLQRGVLSDEQIFRNSEGGLAEVNGNSTDVNLDFMSQLLNLRDADDAFFDGTMDSDFTNAEMNLDGIFDQSSPCGVPFFRPGGG